MAPRPRYAHRRRQRRRPGDGSRACPGQQERRARRVRRRRSRGPLYSPWVIPIPRHITIGIRRRITDPDDPEEVFRFANAPVQIRFQEDPPTGLIINSFFYTSLPGRCWADLRYGGADRKRQRPPRRQPRGGDWDLAGRKFTLTFGYRRDIDPNTKLPVMSTTEPFATIDKALHFEIATVTIDVIATKLGFSFGRVFRPQGRRRRIAGGPGRYFCGHAALRIPGSSN